MKSTAWLFLLLTLAGSIFLSGKVANMRHPQVVQSPTPRAGFNKFLSQVAWIRLIQFRGGMKGVQKDNVEGLVRQYDKLTNLDPLFAKAYECGALDICHESPEEALKLLDKAMKVPQIKNWEIPFTAGFIAKRQLHDDQRAEIYLQKAVKAPGCPSYVRRILINMQAEQYPTDPQRKFNLWMDYYAGGTERRASLTRSKGGEERSPLSEPDRILALKQISRLATEVVEKNQKALWVEKDPLAKKALLERIDMTQKTLKSLYASNHLCPKCFKPYAPGDRFCAGDGTSVETYGLCLKDKSTILHGSYCHICGAKADGRP